MVHTRFFKTALMLGAVATFFAVATVPALAQETGTIQGVVTERGNGQPIEGVQLNVVGTRIIAITDENGAYQLANVPVGNVDIRVRMIGFSREAANATLRATLPLELNFEMRPSVIALEAVVVTGAGAAVEKKQLGNTIATMDMAQIENAPVMSFSEALAAREPGVSVGDNSMTGAGSPIRIRGSNSLAMSNEPVVYLDGVRIDNGAGLTNMGGGAAESSRLDDISPDAIDRVEILKGAAAATLYGSEASGGVIQIFTKQGSRGAPRFSFRVEQGISNYDVTRFKPNAGFPADQTEADNMNEIYGTSLQPFDVLEVPIAQNMFETGRHQVYSANVTGGGEIVNYFVSGRFTYENGPFGATELGPSKDTNRKIQGNTSVTIFPRERLSFRIGALWTDGRQEMPANGNNIYAPLSLAQFAKPENGTCADLDEDGRMDVNPRSEWVNGEIPTCSTRGNVLGNAFMTVREAMQREIGQSSEHFNGNLTASYQAATGLDLEATFGLDVTNTHDALFNYFGYDLDQYTGNNTDGFRYIGHRNHRELSLDIKLNHNTRFSSFSSQFTAGAQGFVSTNLTNGADGYDFPGPGLEVVEATADQVVYENWLQVVNTGLFAQEQIGYNDYVYFTVGGRWDRNSAFGENTGGAFYPKVSMSIIPSDMPGWSSSLLSTFRIRGALGKSGIQPGAFDKFTTFGPDITAEGAALTPDNLGNSDLAPEKSTEIEVGAEFGLLNNKLGLEATYWKRNTIDALVDRQFAVSGGFRSFQLDNIGELEGQGLELKFDWLTLDSRNVTISMFATASWLKERIVSMGSAPPIKVGGSYQRPRHFLKGPEVDPVTGDSVFYAPGSFFGAALEDYVPGSTVPFDIDLDGEPDSEASFRAYLTSTESISVDDDEMGPLMRNDDGDADLLDHFLGKPTPDWQGSWGTTITLMQNLDINLLFEFKTGNFTVENLTDAFRTANGGIGRNTPRAAAVEATLLDPSTQANEQERFDAAMEWATSLRALNPWSGMNTMENARFLGFRELSFAYTMPRSFSSKLGLSNLVLGFSGRNLHKWSGYQGVDQESNGDQSRCTGTGVGCNFAYGMDAFGAPIPRRFTFSLQFGF